MRSPPHRHRVPVQPEDLPGGVAFGDCQKPPGDRAATADEP